MKTDLQQRERSNTSSIQKEIRFQKSTSTDTPTTSKNPTSSKTSSQRTLEDFFDDNWWVADIETFVNCFSLVCLNVLDRTKWLKFVIYKDGEETEYDGYEQLSQFLKTKPSFVGYNWLGFDSQVLESIYRNEVND